MNPGEIAVGTGKVVELGLLADSEDAKGHHAHQEDQQAWRERNQRVPKIALGVDRFGSRHAQVEHEQGHGHREDAVAEGCETLHALSGNTVVKGWHRTETSGSRGRGQNLVSRAALGVEW